MSVFGNIMSAIFGNKAATGAAPGSPAAKAAVPGSGTTAAGAPATGKPITRQEVEAMIAKIAEEQDEDYNWKQSIVDLMKLLKLDSSLNARKQLAQELGYTGKLDGSAEMNIWLHKQVMTKLAESGGQVPDSLRHTTA
jgi:Domain of unknown function (DUF3597)